MNIKLLHYVMKNIPRVKITTFEKQQNLILVLGLVLIMNV